VGRKVPITESSLQIVVLPEMVNLLNRWGPTIPKKDPVEVRFKEEKAIQWLRKGVQPTPTVRQLLIRSGISKKLTEEKTE
jgi:small subunit ribosomal protein S16